MEGSPTQNSQIPILPGFSQFLAQNPTLESQQQISNPYLLTQQKSSYPEFQFQSFGQGQTQQYQNFYLQNQQPLSQFHPLQIKYNRNPLPNEANPLPFIPTAKEILHQQSMRDVRAEISHLRGNILESQ
jgi:hypothetical protein